MAGLTLFVFPKFVYKLTKNETYCRKSVKESSYLTKNGLLLTFNLIFCPFAGGLAAMFVSRGENRMVLQIYRNGHGMTKIVRDICLIALQEQLNLYMRYIIQIVLLCILNQLFQNH